MMSTNQFYLLLFIYVSVGQGSSRLSYDPDLVQSQWEEAFLQVPLESYAYEHTAFYTSAPHSAGTPGDRLMAEFTLAKFQEYGLLNSSIVSIDALLSFPVRRSLTMTSPTYFNATLQEAYIPVDPTTNDPRIIPTFNGYAPTGEAVGELVYLNYATFQDFENLKQMGVELEGKVGIARYGHIFRGSKAMLAQEHRMTGLIIYSDPADDGYVQGAVFPDGPWRPESGVQRGSVSFLSLCPGDPRNPLCSNDPNYNYTHNIPEIPVQPISWGDAAPLLRNLGGISAPSTWQGGLNFTYMIGPGPAIVNLSIEALFEVTPIWDVVAVITGSEEPNKAIILGNHRDAWVFGAADPNSGSATLLEVARGFGKLLNDGWKPKRTIILCSWDGEEYGMIGSTSWADNNADMLLKNAVAYLNVDTAVVGSSFGAGATPSLAALLRNVTQVIIDPNTGKPIADVWNGQVPDLGSGSDFTAFLDRYGIPSMDMGFGGPYGVYHSTYDDIYWMNNFGDPTYKYHKAMAQLWGLVAMRLADSEILPLDYTFYGSQLQSYVSTLASVLQQNNLTMDLSELNQSVANFVSVANAIPSDGSLNDRLQFTERYFLNDQGLPQRPYYRHVLQAPGLVDGYSAEIFPGIQDAIIEGNTTQAQMQYQILVQAINNAANYLGGQSTSH